MGKPKRFNTRVSLSLSQEQVEFLREMVGRGEADSLSQAVRKCISIAMEKAGR